MIEWLLLGIIVGVIAIISIHYHRQGQRIDMAANAAISEINMAAEERNRIIDAYNEKMKREEGYDN